MEKKLDGQLLVHVVYTVKPGCRDRFLRELAAAAWVDGLESACLRIVFIAIKGKEG